MNKYAESMYQLYFDWKYQTCYLYDVCCYFAALNVPKAWIYEFILNEWKRNNEPSV